MATIDFSKIPVKNVKGQTEVKDYKDYLAEQLYNLQPEPRRGRCEPRSEDRQRYG